MSMQGIEIVARMVPPARVTEEKAERIYSCLQENFAIKSVDMFLDEDDNSIRFLFGIEVTSVVSDEDAFVEEVAEEALNRAFAVADDNGPTLIGPELIGSRVLAFI